MCLEVWLLYLSTGKHQSKDYVGNTETEEELLKNQASLRVMQKCGMSLTDHTDDIDYRGTHHVCRYCEINF